MLRIVRFGVFEVDLQTGELRKCGLKIGLQDQPFRVLAQLLRHPGEVVTRDDIRQELWSSDTFVDFDRGLNTAVNKIREALGDSAVNPRFVETVPRRGYRFIAAVEAAGEPAQPEPHPVQPYEIQPHRTARPVYFTAGIALLFVMAIIGARLAPRFGSARSRSVKSIAVLPLENLSGDPSQEYFADGMTEELITELAKIGSLRVNSRSSIMQFKKTRLPLARIARELNVDAVVEGGVRCSRERVRITAQLVDAATDRHLWADTYERELRDVLTLQAEVASTIANQVKARVSPEQAVAPVRQAVNPAAYEAHLKARYCFYQRTGDGLQKSIEFFQQAIAIDPGYALAYAGMADSYVNMGTSEMAVSNDVFPRARAAATKALEINNTLAEPHTALGYVALAFDRDWPGAEREFREAIRLNPSYVTAHHWYADYLDITGRPEQAIAEVKRAQELDPLSLIVNSTLGRIYRDNHQYEAAMSQCRKALELDPHFAHAHWCLGLAYLGKARNQDAIAELEQARALGFPAIGLQGLGYAYAVSGKKSRAKEIIAELQRGYPRYYGIATVYVGLGERERALDWLDRGHRARDAGLMRITCDPLLDSLRSEPRFISLLKKMRTKDEPSPL